MNKYVHHTRAYIRKSNDDLSSRALEMKYAVGTWMETRSPAS